MFPHYDENRKGHQRLITELHAIRNIMYHFVYKENTTQADAKETSKKTNHLMRKWFIDHTIKSDMKMKGFMDNAR